MRIVSAPECVLVVDDDQEIRESLAEVLQEHGCSAIAVANGAQALETLQNLEGERACLILLDLMMPVMDGRAFRQEQMRHEELANIPVVLISAFANVRDEASDMNVAGYLQKPFQLSDIIQTAKTYCGCDRAVP
jgi:two-component system, chemotaxis family, chemotaxis protein CheY